MYPDSPYAGPSGSFLVPVEPPDVDADGGVTCSISINVAWLPFVRGALTQLMLQATWATDIVSLDLTQQRVTNLIALFGEGTCGMDCGCFIFSNGGWEIFVPDGMGGGSFQPVDPRTQGTATPPWTSPPVGQTGNCLAGANIAEVFTATVKQMGAGLDAGVIFTGIVSGLVSLLLLVFPPGDVIVEALFGLADAAIAEGASSWGSAFDTSAHSDVYDELKCAINCSVSSDGSVSSAQITAIKDTFASQMPLSLSGGEVTLWETVLGAFLDSYGPIGLTKLGNMGGIVSADCSGCVDCLWTSTFDFTASDYAGIWGVTRGEVYAAGIGWQSSFLNSSSQQQIYLQASFSAVTINTVEFDFTAAGGSGANNGYGTNASGFNFHDTSGLPTGIGHEAHSGSIVSDTFLGLYTNSGTSSNPQVLTRAVIRGSGTRPAGWPAS